MVARLPTVTSSSRPVGKIVIWRPALLLVALVAAMVVAVVVYALMDDTDARSLLRADDPNVVAKGAEVYAAHCASCHGVNLEGQANWRSKGPDGLMPAPPHDETGHTWHHTDDVLFALTKYGLAGLSGADYASAMPIYDGILSDEDIVAALSFIKSRWPDDIQARHDDMNMLAPR